MPNNQSEYISALTGEEMDNALMLVNSGEAKKWTDGADYAGNPVPEGAAQFENNSKYWAEVARNSIEGHGVTSAVRWDIEQDLTAEAKAQARVNMGVDTVVRYDEAQTLTDEQKAQARENIGVFADVVRYGAQTLTAAQKAQAATNLGLGAAANKGVTDNTSTAGTFASNDANVITARTLYNALGRSSSVAVANTDYGAPIARGIVLSADASTVTLLNGQICLEYK